MDLQNVENYKFYKCRSLLACDSGGTVYDTSKNFHEKSYNEKSMQSKSTWQNETGQSEKIIYIIDSKGQFKTENRSLVDLTTHLDDDEFNDYEMKSNMTFEPTNQIAQHVQNENRIMNFDETNGNLESLINKDEIDKSVLCLFDEILEHEDTFKIQHSQPSQDSNNTNNSNYFKSCNNSIAIDNSIENHTINEQEECNIQYLSNLSLNKTTSLELEHVSRQETSEFDFNVCNMEKVEPYKKYVNKRKQIYHIREHQHNELVDETADALKVMDQNSKYKKKKLVYNKENQTERLLNQKKNPFANVKMSSILKGNKKKIIKKNKIFSKEQKIEPISNYEGHYTSNSSYSNDEDIIYKNDSNQINDFYSSNSKDVLQVINPVEQLTLDLSNADYMDYVQPRERIIESDMDKLLSPTIENEFMEKIKTLQLTNEIKNPVDCNGNEVGFEDNQKIKASQSVLTPSQIAERELFLKSAYAKKLGYENYFNTSNDAVINEVLFGTKLVYEQINLEIDFIRNSDMYLKQNLLSNAFLKSVSCTLLESLNELHRFGGFIDENSQEKYIINKEKAFTNLTQKLNEKDKKSQKDSNFTFNFNNKSNLLGIDSQLRCSALDNPPNTSYELKQSSGPLIIKMKRINEGNNEYVIDDSNKRTTKTVKKNLSQGVKNIHRYECHDCSEKFRTKRNLKNHVSEYHRGPYDIECSDCHMKFKKSSAHKKHMPWCPKSIIHKCDQCDRVYCYLASLIKHQKTHQA